MTVLDEAGVSAAGAEVPSAPEPPDAGPPARRRRWATYLILAAVLFATVTGIVLFGIDTASAAGGCGGG